MLSQLPTAERRRIAVYRFVRRSLEIWGHLWPLLLMLAMSGAFWWYGCAIANSLAR